MSSRIFHRSLEPPSHLAGRGASYSWTSAGLRANSVPVEPRGADRHVLTDEPLGVGGQVLHEWAMGADTADAEALAADADRLGALIAGRRTYDASIRWWGADGPTGPRRLPLFVVTHRVPDDVPTDGVYTFVTDGPEAALEQARAAAGDADVAVMGGPDLGQQYLA